MLSPSTDSCVFPASRYIVAAQDPALVSMAVARTVIISVLISVR